MLRRLTQAALVFVTLWAFFACSSNDSTEGQLILAVQTDMSVPEDVDKVRIEILSFGNVQFANDFAVGESGLQIPATLGILPGKDPSSPVTIRVISKQQDTVRTLREVVTTVPADRVATLRVPIQWLCDDTVEQEGKTVKSTCPAGETCVAGTCKKKELDSDNLPDFQAEDIFGGASGPGQAGTCFDTVPCFADGFSAPVEESDCSIAMPDDEGKGVSVGIVTPKDGGGICGSQACIVPLDANSDVGWQTTEGGRIQLPEAVCTRLGDGRALAVAVTTSCVQKTEGIPTCGPWSSVKSEPGSFDGRAPRGVLEGGAGGSSADVGIVSEGVVSLDIGPEGGSLTSADGVLTVTVPPEAVADTFTLTIGDAPDAPAGNIGAAYEVGPTGQQFDVPVEISYDFSRFDLGSATPDELQVATVDPNSADVVWTPLSGRSIDASAGVVVGVTDHFSPFGLIAGGACEPQVMAAERQPTTLYLMVDNSMAMSEPAIGTDTGTTRWQEMAAGLDQFLNDPASANVNVAVKFHSDIVASPCDGATFTFPDIGVDQAQANAQPVADWFSRNGPTSAMGLVQGPVAGITGFLDMRAMGGPPNEVLAGVLYSGGPVSGVCPEVQTLAVDTASSSQFPIFTMYAGDADSSLMTSIAISSGGEAFPGENALDIENALRSVRDQTASCTFNAPPDLDPATFGVFLSDPDGRRQLTQIPASEASSGCGDIEGWFTVSSGVIALCPAACSYFIGATGTQLEYEVGCPVGSGSAAGGGGDGLVDSGAPMAGAPLTTDECLTLLSTRTTTQCASCDCTGDVCLSPISDCVNETGCIEIIDCMSATECPDLTSCYQPATCQSVIDSAGGPDAAAANAAYAVADCQSSQCGSVCLVASGSDGGVSVTQADGGAPAGGGAPDASVPLQ